MTHREIILSHGHPDRHKLVWESAGGPLLVEEMDAGHLRNALAFAARTGFKSGAIPAMRERLSRLDAQESA